VSRLTRGQAALVARQRVGAVPAGTITYSRNAESVDLTGNAWVGRTVFRRTELQTEGASIVFGDRDYLIVAAALVLGGVRITPKEGDLVTETLNGVAVEFRVSALPGEDAWRWSDAGRTVLRAHVKQHKR
jgi:hypothetical protein